jgi:hypothetical protein
MIPRFPANGPTWGCAGVQQCAGSLRLTSPGRFTGRFIVRGPCLEVAGDFSLIARFSISTTAGDWVEAAGH